jgi:hypothetical protein
MHVRAAGEVLSTLAIAQRQHVQESPIASQFDGPTDLAGFEARFGFGQMFIGVLCELL